MSLGELPWRRVEGKVNPFSCVFRALGQLLKINWKLGHIQLPINFRRVTRATIET